MKNNTLKQHITPNIPYIFVLWLCWKIGEAYRIADGANIVYKLMGTVQSLNTVIANPAPSLNLRDFFIGIAGTAVIYAVVYSKKKNAKKFRKNIEYGSARWGKSDDIKPYIDPVPDNNIILTQTESLTMNSRPPNPKYARNKNVLVIGGSGSGKTRFFVKPNILQMHSSYVITDPKGLLVSECGKVLQENGYQIKVLNTVDFSKSMRYNPFDYIRSEKDILKFVTALISNTKGDGKSGDDFWESATRSHTNTILQEQTLWA